MAKNPYPEHAKLKAVKDKSQAIGDFLEWLASEDEQPNTGPVCLAYYPFITERPVYTKNLEVSHYAPIPRQEWERSSELCGLHFNVQPLLARFFGIDLNKLEAEKRAMLDECRALHQKSA